MKMAGLFFFFLGLFFVPILTDRSYNHESDLPKQESAIRELQSEIFADSVLKTLTLDEKIAQLIMLDVYPNKNETYYKTIDNWVNNKKIGGIIFFRGQPAEIARLSNRYTSQAEIPLWVALDAEWGVSMRVDSIRRLPYALTLGAITDNSVVREYGFLVGKQCNRMGVNMNMAPVADVNNNPRNPVINYRSFGENPKNVALKAIAYYMGMNDAGVVAVAKHFPGHGNTDADSHYELPLVNDARNVIDSIHLYPFREMIKYGVPGIMSAHLFVPAIDSTKNQATSLSHKALNELLFEQMKFHGILITDALGMQGVSDHNKPGQTEVKALMAGNDILLMPKNPQLAIDSIKAAVNAGRIPISLINEKCKKLLKFKYLYLNGVSPVQSFTVIPDELNNYETDYFIFRIFSHAITLVSNKDDLLPLRNNPEEAITIVSVGKAEETDFVRCFREYGSANHLTVQHSPTESEISSVLGVETGKVIVCLYGMNNSAKRRYGISENTVKLLEKVSQQKQIVVVLFGNPYGLNYLSKIQQIRSLVVAYEEHEESEMAAAMCVAGVLPFQGKLPVSAGGFEDGTGIVDEFVGGMRFVDPLELKINTSVLDEIDKIVEDAITKGAMPGCQIVLAQHGNIFYHKSFGHHTYDKFQAVTNSDLYDLASLTKILATTLAVMRLFDEDKISLDDTFSKYLTWMSDYPAGNLTISEVMTHQSGLISWIPYYRAMIVSDSIRSLYIADTFSPEFSQPIAENLWANVAVRDTIFNKILSSELQRKRYKYSDLGFYLLKELVETITEESFERYLYHHFYAPMKLNTITFNPLDRFSKDRVAPTENDKEFRQQLVHGYVHDQGAALLGGVSGHAGLFANSLDVASLMQMFMDYGTFAGQRYLDSMTVVKFTAKQFPNNRRALGFDKPANVKDKGNTCEQASSLSFGHTGFTGTFAWADPKYGLVVVFLSNRVYPDSENRKLMSLEVRANVQRLAYKAINVQ
jgi:beta-N-acetylhexosaminidase